MRRNLQNVVVWSERGGEADEVVEENQDSVNGDIEVNQLTWTSR